MAHQIDTHTTPLFTIITVVKNDVHALLRTIQSVYNRKWAGLEYIIIDGGSSDGTLELIRQHDACIDLWISEQDSGIYDAMNKGIIHSTGGYLLFLNAGDELVADLNALSPTLANGHSIVYGKANMLHENGTLSYVKGKLLKNINKLIRGTPLCHQAILYNRDSIGLYDTSFKVIADRVLTYTIIKQFGIFKTQFVDMVIANYYEGGFSRQHEDQWKEEEFQFQWASNWHFYAAYRKFSWLFKKNVIRTLQQLLRKEDHVG